MQREMLGFEYTRPMDPSRLVPTEELSELEIMDRLWQILKGVSAVPARIAEYDAEHPPPTVCLFAS